MIQRNIIILIFSLLLALRLEAQSTLQVTAKSESNHLLQQVKVTLIQGGSEVVQMTGSDGSTVFSEVAHNQVYQLRFDHPVYTFDTISDSLSANKISTVTGAGSLQTLSGNVLNGDLQPIGDATLILNNSLPVTVNAETGAFRIDLEYGSAYSLTISHEDMIFFKDTVSGSLRGDVERIFIGYNK